MSGGSAERLLAVLDLFTEDRLHWTTPQMMARLGYARPTLYRYLKTLCDTGFLSPGIDGAYTIGPRVVELDFLMRKSDRLAAVAAPHLTVLAQEFPGTAFLVKWYGQKLLCVASESRDATARTSYARGRPMPLARGALSRVIMAHLPKRQQVQLIAAHAADLAAIGQGDTVEAVLANLKPIRRRRVAVAYGEVTPGVVGTSAPVLDPAGRPLAALCVSMKDAPYAALDPDTVCARVRASADMIAAAVQDAPATQSARTLHLTGDSGAAHQTTEGD